MPVFTNVRAALRLDVGTCIRWLPDFGPSAEWEAQRFQKKYGGQDATIVGFKHEYVGLLDADGRRPGVYLKDNALLAKFDDDRELWLHPHQCLVIGAAEFVEPPAKRSGLMGKTEERLGDLPEPIRFYPGDVVRCVDEDELVHRRVREITIQTVASVEGRVVYFLDPIAAEVAARREERRVLREANPGKYFLTSDETLEGLWERTATADEIVLLEKGNTRRVYEGEDATFDSLEAALQFWSNSGLSEHVHSRVPHLFDAAECIEQGEADFIICDRTKKDRHGGRLVDLGGEWVCCSARRLRAAFSIYREGVREIGLLVCRSTESV